MNCIQGFRSFWGKGWASVLVAFVLLAAAHAQSQQPQTLPDNAARIARGAYLVEGLGHCGACHTPRGVGMQEQAYNERGEDYLSGAVIEGWLASSLRTMTLSHEEIVMLLQKGMSQSKGVSGPMKEVVSLSMQYATVEDLNSIAAYLVCIQQPLPAQTVLPAASVDPQGAFLYYTYCSVCHGELGEGVASGAPRLAGNNNVMAQDPRNMVHVITKGENTPVTMARPGYAMPAYGETLKAQEIVQIMNYMRASWGNQAAPITEKQYHSLLK
ncbi:MAG: c-type cytochrome [Saezia sp.]